MTNNLYVAKINFYSSVKSDSEITYFDSLKEIKFSQFSLNNIFFFNIHDIYIYIYKVLH